MSLVELPVEVVYRILDYIDIRSILRSFRYVCQRFYWITNSYNRYEFDLSSIAQVNMKLIARLILPENIIALSVSDGWHAQSIIDQFFRLFDKNQLSQLRSLTLTDIRCRDVIHILEVFAACPLISLSLTGSRRWSNENPIPLASALTQFKLCKLILKNVDSSIAHMSWKHISTLQYITLDNCTLSQYQTILSSLPHLKAFMMRDCIIQDRNQTYLNSYPQLLSLSIIDCHLSIDDIQFVIFQTPSLVHLQLASRRKEFDSAFDGSFWNHFISLNLSSLATFQFFFSYTMSETDVIIDVDSLLHSFQRLVWWNNITCDYNLHRRMTNLYTMPILINKADYLPESMDISSSPLIAIRWKISSIDVDLLPNLKWVDGIFDLTSTEV